MKDGGKAGGRAESQTWANAESATHPHVKKTQIEHTQPYVQLSTGIFTGLQIQEVGGSSQPYFPIVKVGFLCFCFSSLSLSSPPLPARHATRRLCLLSMSLRAHGHRIRPCSSGSEKRTHSGPFCGKVGGVNGCRSNVVIQEGGELSIDRHTAAHR